MSAEYRIKQHSRLAEGQRQPASHGGWLPTLAGVALGPLSALAQEAAGAKDAQAEKAIQLAMEGDFLETRFDKAQQKLSAAIEACGEAGCSKKVKARLYVSLGTVQCPPGRVRQVIIDEARANKITLEMFFRVDSANKSACNVTSSRAAGSNSSILID